MEKPNRYVLLLIILLFLAASIVPLLKFGIKFPNNVNVKKASSKYPLDPRLKTIQIAQQVLVEKYNITVTDDEIKEFINDNFGSMIHDDSFAEIKENIDAQAAAVAAVVEDGMSPRRAADTYLKPLGPVELFMPMLENADQKRLDEMRRMIPENREDMFAKSIEGYRSTVEMIKLAPFVLPEEKRQGDYNDWDVEYNTALLDYARENLIGKHPLLMDVEPR